MLALKHLNPKQYHQLVDTNFLLPTRNALMLDGTMVTEARGNGHILIRVGDCNPTLDGNTIRPGDIYDAFKTLGVTYDAVDDGGDLVGRNVELGHEHYINSDGTQEFITENGTIFADYNTGDATIYSNKSNTTEHFELGAMRGTTFIQMLARLCDDTDKPDVEKTPMIKLDPNNLISEYTFLVPTKTYEHIENAEVLVAIYREDGAVSVCDGDGNVTLDGVEVPPDEVFDMLATFGMHYEVEKETGNLICHNPDLHQTHIIKPNGSQCFRTEYGQLIVDAKGDRQTFELASGTFGYGLTKATFADEVSIALHMATLCN